MSIGFRQPEANTREQTPMHLVNKNCTVFVHSTILTSANVVLVTVPSLEIQILNILLHYNSI